MVEVAESSWHAAAIDALAVEVADDGNRPDLEIRESECRKQQEENDFHPEILEPLIPSLISHRSKVVVWSLCLPRCE